MKKRWILLTGILLAANSFASFKIVAIPDTQRLTQYNPSYVSQQTSWIVNNLAAKDIKFVTHLGDLVDDDTSTQWNTITTALGMLDGEVPYSVCMGNHDFDGKLSNQPAIRKDEGTTQFTSRFGSSRYAGYSWYKGSNRRGLNHYQIFNADGRDWLHLNLEYQPDDESLLWGQRVLDTHPDLPVIFSTHSYLRQSGDLGYSDTAVGGLIANGGQNIWNKFVRHNDQIFMVLNGHYFSGTDGVARLTSQNDFGHDVFQMCINYQGVDTDASLRLLEFDSVNDAINATTYDPHANSYKTDSENQFSLSIDFDVRLSGFSRREELATVQAVNLLVVENNTDNNATSVTVTIPSGQSTDGVSVILTKSNNGDYAVQFGSRSEDDLLGGITLASVAENGRTNLGTFYESYHIAQATAGGDGQCWLAIADTARDLEGTSYSGGAERDVSVAVAYFPFDQGWAAGRLTSIDDGSPTWSFMGSENIELGGNLTQVPQGTLSGDDTNLLQKATSAAPLWGNPEADRAIWNLTLPGVNSLSDGILLICGGKNEDNYAAASPYSDGLGWQITLHDSSGSGWTESDPWNFVYVPYSTENIVAGRCNVQGTITSGTGGFALAANGTGSVRLDITGYTPADGTLIVSSENDWYNGDDFVTYEPEIDHWIIENRDLPEANLASSSTPQFTFLFIPFNSPPTEPGASLGSVNTWTGNGANNLWSNFDNWDIASYLPELVVIDATGNDPLVNMDVAVQYDSVYFGVSNSAEVVLSMQSGGYLRTDSGGAIVFGRASGSNARSEMTGGNLSGRQVRVGESGTGTMNMSGGDITVSDWVGVGANAGSAGTLNMSGGAISAYNVTAGHHGAGTIDISGGTVTANNWIGVARYSDAIGSSITLRDSGSLQSHHLSLGLDGSGTFDMQGGTFTLTGTDGRFRMGEGPGAGTWNMSGGTAIIGDYISLGYTTDGAGIINMTGGEIRTGDLWLGRQGNGTINLSNGTINVNYYNDGDGLLFDTDGGDGLLNLSGGTLYWMYGDYTAEVQAWILSGDIVAYNGTEGVSVVYDLGSDSTIIMATDADSIWTGNGADNLWITSANWNPLPFAGGIATIDITNNSPLVNMDVSDIYEFIHIAETSTDEVELTVQSGGHLRQNTSSGGIWTAKDFGSKGRIDLSNGGVIDGYDFVLGQRGTGTFEMTGGALNISRNLYMGDGDGHGVTTFNVFGGTADIGSWVGVGRQSGDMSTMTVSGTGYLEASHMSLGLADGDGTLVISDSGHVNLNTSGSRLRVGELAEGSGATGTINMNGGTLEVGLYIALGYTAGSSGSMDMTDGDVVTPYFVVGLNGDGTFETSGGNVLSTAVKLGEGAGQGTWNMSGGLVEATNYVCVGWGTSAGETDLLDMTGGEIRTGDLHVGRYGSGTVNLSGGTILVNVYGSGTYTNGLRFDTNGGNGTLNLAGGTLNWMGGNHTSEASAFVSSGDVVAYEGAETVSIVYDSGSNTTIIQAGGTPFESWMLGYGLSGGDAAATNDYDGDGIVNLGEYALGGNPTNILDKGYSTYGQLDGIWLNYIYPKRSDPDSGLIYYLETTDDLIFAGWTNGNYEVTGTNTSFAPGFHAVSNRVSIAVKDEQFIHLIVEEN